jgi:hypothetical protein
MNPFCRRKRPAGHLLWGLAVMFLLVSPAAGFQFNAGDMQGSLDTTLSYGLSWRVAERDEEIVGLANGGKAYSVNGDDGNLNFGREIFSNAVKATSELDLKYKNVGVFVRGSGFYDFEYKDGNRDHIDLTDEALDLVGSDVRLLDAYFSAGFDLLGRPVEFRIGEQLVSWGESTFFQNSINTINPVDVSAIRLPGAELKEALLPEGMIYAAIGLSEMISVEGFYLYDWDNTDIDPPGSYFSTSDFAGDGGSRVMLGWGRVWEFGTNLGPLGFDPDFLAVGRAADQDADDDGQFGVALRLFTPMLADAEFGFYFMNYHSRVPVISAQTGTVAGVDLSSSAAFGARVANLTAAGFPYATAVSTAASLSVDAYSQTARYFLEYPEDIQLFGVSFNTDLGTSGIALQGEVSHRRDVPLQVDDIELLLAALSPIGFNPAYKDNQLRVFGADETIHGYIEKDITQVQATATKAFGPTLRANTFILVGEVGWTHVHNMPDKDELRLESSGTYTSGNASQSILPGTDPTKPFGGAHAGIASEPSDNFADQDSWGYRIAGRLEYSNAVGPVGLTPHFAWQHDVQGNSPGPGGNFLEGRKAVTLGLTAGYLTNLTMDISYTCFFGGSRYNLINDRDFIGANIKYSF